MLSEHSLSTLIKSGEAPFSTALMTLGLAPHNSCSIGIFFLMHKDMITLACTQLDTVPEIDLSSGAGALVSPVVDQSTNNHGPSNHVFKSFLHVLELPRIHLLGPVCNL